MLLEYIKIVISICLFGIHYHSFAINHDILNKLSAHTRSLAELIRIIQSNNQNNSFKLQKNTIKDLYNDYILARTQFIQYQKDNAIKNEYVLRTLNERDILALVEPGYYFTSHEKLFKKICDAFTRRIKIEYDQLSRADTFININTSNPTTNDINYIIDDLKQKTSSGDTDLSDLKEDLLSIRTNFYNNSIDIIERNMYRLKKINQIDNIIKNFKNIKELSHEMKNKITQLESQKDTKIIPEKTKTEAETFINDPIEKIDTTLLLSQQMKTDIGNAMSLSVKLNQKESALLKINTENQKIDTNQLQQVLDDADKKIHKAEILIDKITSTNNSQNDLIEKLEKKKKEYENHKNIIKFAKKTNELEYVHNQYIDGKHNQNYHTLQNTNDYLTKINRLQEGIDRYKELSSFFNQKNDFLNNIFSALQKIIASATQTLQHNIKQCVEKIEKIQENENRHNIDAMSNNQTSTLESSHNNNVPQSSDINNHNPQRNDWFLQKITQLSWSTLKWSWSTLKWIVTFGYAQ